MTWTSAQLERSDSIDAQEVQAMQVRRPAQDAHGAEDQYAVWQGKVGREGDLVADIVEHGHAVVANTQDGIRVSRTKS